MKIKEYQRRKHLQRSRHDTRIRKRPDHGENRAHARKRQKDSRRIPDVHKRAHREPDPKLFRHAAGHQRQRENFQTTRPANPATLHRLLSPFARMTRVLRK